ncbi:alcohol dehydrogenase [Paraphoma chrysanthemicola]|uniref:Alcohol dehydrogenase n=1 Tax=Paraphoma chrysanthemicola TaxID=798071 RepID=A0A8K0R7K6_9PLEO|nr:alcohol dehydrogenase [Paraphoma chrysanthemicola]
MTSTMKAYRFETPSEGLIYKDVPVPVPESNQVLVRIKAAGICHTDINIITGKDDTFFWKRPITLGHELAGEIVEIGANVTNFKVGDRVVAAITTKHPLTFGDVTTSPGIGKDGGFAEYVTVLEAKTVRIPDDVTFAHAAVATDAVATAYHSVIVDGEVTAGSKVAIIGLGGLGLSAAQIAVRQGAKVYGIELDTRKYVPAAQVGVYSCAKSFAKFPGARFDVILDFAGTGATTVAAAKAVRPGGRVVLIGLANRTAPIDTYELIALGVTIKASGGSSIQEVEKCLQMIADKEFDPTVEEVNFRQLKEGIDKLASGNVIGRLFTDPSKISG